MIIASLLVIARKEGETKNSGALAARATMCFFLSCRTTLLCALAMYWSAA